ncbi:hypothetical protein [Flexivirga alba]|uniref:Uncharacterized protein n=1 Tax=Flexivirga alba TaxID=702742 RepID=A0ABW2AF04_9MICO
MPTRPFHALVGIATAALITGSLLAPVGSAAAAPATAPVAAAANHLPFRASPPTPTILPG